MSRVRTFVRFSFCHVRGTSVKIYKTLHYKDPLMDFIYIRRDRRYRSKVLLSFIPIPGSDNEVKVTDLKFSYKSQKLFALMFILLYYQDP